MQRSVSLNIELFLGTYKWYVALSSTIGYGIVASSIPPFEGCIERVFCHLHTSLSKKVFAFLRWISSDGAQESVFLRNSLLHRTSPRDLVRFLWSSQLRIVF
jgi:hypothetical protein